ncbi:MAG: glycosyl transferase family 1 [Salinicola sp.]|uniref:glycosyltransferase n=1 Tax=uncultured Salinicola sp. TaxID=1193542 RepID=UPI000C9690C4|nr:glycosyltransferase [uncultured Salinicola sp.]MAM58848.1 glycosyl transferase family 1 [Salinicola sp.]|tara:strand:+ start:709 stop:1896 length:1188 start_codon:yes stop_codon:yes gene_type:complete
MEKFDIVMLSTADWDNPFWTNKQHVARELARRGHRVFYINSLGLRQPSFNRSDMKRIAARLKSFFSWPRQVEENVIVWSPIVIPLQRFSLVRRINRLSLGLMIRLLTRCHGFRSPVLWTYNPLTLRLLDVSRYRFLIYHCVDEIKAQPDMPVLILEESEKRLVEESDVVFVTAPKLFETRQRWNDKTWFFPNVADYRHFSRANEPSTPVSPVVARLDRPVIGFVGAISGYKVDFPLLEHLALSRPDYQIVLVGKIGEGDPYTDIRRLEALPNVHFPGPAAYADLPGILKGFDVAILPSLLNEYTANMFPMKFFEYLAAGKPVVATALPALAEFCHMAEVGIDADDFATKVDLALARDDALSISRRQLYAHEHTYEARTGKMMEIVSHEMMGYRKP